ncbi:MAG: hypothetical protein IT373_00765 [Polyangiaceae bacterium]|nr:hypothetical protein [Polyangiaceae bacterium]
MHVLIAHPGIVKLLGGFGLIAIGALGCMGPGDGAAARELAAGKTALRAGLAVVRDGVARLETGARDLGLARVDLGLGDMMRGVDQMHAGVQMMLDGDTAGCCEGMADHAMMEPVERAMDTIGLGYSEMADAMAGNDAVGATHLHDGITSMEAGLVEADRATSCGDMMGGGM